MEVHRERKTWILVYSIGSYTVDESKTFHRNVNILLEFKLSF